MAILAKRDKTATRSAIILAIIFHVIVGFIFYKYGGGEKLAKDFIATIIPTRKPPPPPPPKKPPPKVKINKRPPMIKPKFTVDKVSPFKMKTSSVTDLIPQIDMEILDDPEFDNMMEWDGGITDDEGGASINIVALNVLDHFKLSPTVSKKSKKKAQVYGYGRRTRGRFSITYIQFKSLSISLIDDGGLKYFIKYMNEETDIKVDGDSKIIDLEFSFKLWLKKSKETIIKPGIGDNLAEIEFLDGLEFAANTLYKTTVDAKDSYSRLLWDTFENYIFGKYEFHVEGRSLQEVMVDVDKEGVEIWRRKGIETVYKKIKKIDDIKTLVDVDELGNEMEEIWLFAKKAEILTAPIIFIHGGADLNTFSEQAFDILRTYIANGGFLWVDDDIVSPDRWRDIRQFIQQITVKDELDAITRSIYKKFQRQDLAVSGYEFIGNKPNPFHPPESYSFPQETQQETFFSAALPLQ